MAGERRSAIVNAWAQKDPDAAIRWPAGNSALDAAGLDRATLNLIAGYATRDVNSEAEPISCIADLGLTRLILYALIEGKIDDQQGSEQFGGAAKMERMLDEIEKTAVLGFKEERKRRRWPLLSDPSEQNSTSAFAGT